MLLKSTQLTNDLLNFILKLLETQKSLKLIDLSDNLLTDDCVEYLTKFSENREKLSLLDLSKNKITSKGFVRLIKAAGLCERLDVQENKIGLHALNQIADAGETGCESL